MTIIEKSVTPFGTEIQLEDWCDVYPNVGRYTIGGISYSRKFGRVFKKG